MANIVSSLSDIDRIISDLFLPDTIFHKQKPCNPFHRNDYIETNHYEKSVACFKTERSISK